MSDAADKATATHDEARPIFVGVYLAAYDKARTSLVSDEVEEAGYVMYALLSLLSDQLAEATPEEREMYAKLAATYEKLFASTRPPEAPGVKADGGAQ